MRIVVTFSNTRWRDALKAAAKLVRGLRAGLTVSEREAVADEAVSAIRNLPDDPWKLSEELPRLGYQPGPWGVDAGRLVQAEKDGAACRCRRGTWVAGLLASRAASTHTTGRRPSQ
jgi:hypothetical protein